MKITVGQAYEVYLGLRAIDRVNDTLPSVYIRHMRKIMPVLHKEAQEIEKLDGETREKWVREEIELPIYKISIDILPDKIPTNIESNIGRISAMELINPILKQEEHPEYESQVARLVEGQENGVEENGVDVG